jgi:tetratricopeptide (TPR) repeat protein
MELVYKLEPTLCLNMIVKNESKIITRLFDSVLPIIDSYCICDTGSTDNTIQIITDYFQSKNIPGKIVEEPFKNFCYNRTFALTSAIGMSDYLLLLDADMILEVKNFNKNDLIKCDNYHILQGNDNFYYLNMRIIKNNGLYKYVGVTHEHIDTPSNSTSKLLEKNELFIRDIGDGGAKHDKFERDIKLLTEGILEEPNNARYHFYLGNSYHDLGRFNEAIEMYKKRIEFGGWREEVWYSYYRIGLCYKHMGNLAQAFFYWLEGFHFYNERLEGMYEMIKHYRYDSKHKLCSLLYDSAIKILNEKHTRDQYLFLQNDVYTHKLYYEYTIFACYLGIKNINDEIIIVLNNSKDDNEKNNLLQNMKFYKDVLKQNVRMTIDKNIKQNINNENIEFYSSSSCLIPNNDGYHMNQRFVNYYINEHGNYLNCDKHIITVNKYTEFDKEFNIINEKFFELNYDNRLYVGIEDIRVFSDIETNQLKYIGTGYHKNNKIGIVTGNYDYENGKLNVNEVTQQFQNTGCEKNWVFVDYQNSTHIIYDWSPLRIGKIITNNSNNLELVITEKREMPQLFSRVRGSTCGFKYMNPNNLKNEIWFVNHIVSYENPRHYYHIFVVFDESMNLLRYSAPFKFEGEPIEYCLSVIVQDKRILMNYSTWDRTTRIGIYDKKYIDSIVKYNHP